MFFFSTESHKHKNIQRVGALAYRVGVYHLISSHLKVKRASRVSTAEGVGRGEGGEAIASIYIFRIYHGSVRNGPRTVQVVDTTVLEVNCVYCIRVYVSVFVFVCGSYSAAVWPVDRLFECHCTIGKAPLWLASLRHVLYYE